MNRKDQIWGQLSDLVATANRLSMKVLNDGPQRDSKFSIEIEGVHLDFSRHLINQSILDTLTELARASNIKEKALDMLEGKPVNKTECKSATHVYALRRYKPKSERKKTDVQICGGHTMWQHEILFASAFHRCN